MLIVFEIIDNIIYTIFLCFGFYVTRHTFSNLFTLIFTKIKSLFGNRGRKNE